MALKGLRRYDGVTAFTGMPGSGKTYALAQIADRARRAGVPVWCNGGFDIADCVANDRVFSSFEEFLYIPNGSIVVWDELPLYVNSRKWAEFPDGLLYRLTQVRKDGLRLYYSAIDEEMVDVTVRRLTFWYWHCQAITGRLLRRQLWPPERNRKAKTRPYRKEVLRVNLRIAATYDTHGKVAAPVELESKKPAVKWAVVDLEKGPRSALALGQGDEGSSAPDAPADKGRRGRASARSSSGSPGGGRIAAGERTAAGRREAADSSRAPAAELVATKVEDGPPLWGPVKHLS